MTQLVDLDLSMLERGGKYVAAVSGGVDSVVLLELLNRTKAYDLVVAHYNHHIRDDSDEDEKLVREICDYYGLKFFVGHAAESEIKGEQQARDLRYKFLEKVLQDTNSRAIITAHHRDDLVETVLINLLRGTGWRGVAPLSNTLLIRPMKNVEKSTILSFARKNNLVWRDDSTNQDNSLLRNKIRNRLLPALDKIDQSFKDSIYDLAIRQIQITKELDEELTGMLIHKQTKNRIKLSRYEMIMLDAQLSEEILSRSCKMLGRVGVLRANLEMSLIFIKTARPDSVMELGKDLIIRVSKEHAVVERLS